VIDSVLDYFKFQTVANIKIIQEKQAQFPTISVCGTPSFNNFTIDKLILIRLMRDSEKSYSQNECYRLFSHLFAFQESNCNCKTTFYFLYCQFN
jgi:hypothetical protein